MTQSVRRWLPFALCCAPGAVAAFLVAGIAFGGAAFGLTLNSPIGIGLLGVAMLACPASMVLMMRGNMRASAASDAMSCCAPQDEGNPTTTSLADLRAQLENGIAALQRPSSAEGTELEHAAIPSTAAR